MAIKVIFYNSECIKRSIQSLPLLNQCSQSKGLESFPSVKSVVNFDIARRKHSIDKIITRRQKTALNLPGTISDVKR